MLGTLATGTMAVIAGCLGDEEGPPSDGDTVDDLPVPTLGSGSIEVEVFTDFSCPGCRTFKDQVTPMLYDEYVEPDVISYRHRDFPFIDDESWEVASGARAVQDAAGDETYFDFATRIFDYQGSYDIDAIETVAEEVGIDGAVAGEAAEHMTYRPVIEDDIDHGEDLGVGGTPSVAVNGELVDVDDAQSVVDAIEAER